MEESRIELPAWLPWATTACLAALVACLGELWIIERMRSRLLQDESTLAQAELRSAQNQLEAERLLNRGEIAGLRAAGGPQADPRVALLLPAGEAAGRAPPAAFAAVAWDPREGRGELRLVGLPELGPERDYQLWLEGPGTEADCGVLHGAPETGGVPVKMPAAAGPGCRFLLVEGPAGGAPSLAQARSGGSIVLASVPIGGNISK